MVPQIIAIVMFSISVAATLMSKEKESAYKVGVLLGHLVWIDILYFGGFWAPMLHAVH